MNLYWLKNKAPKIAKAHPVAFGFSVAIHLLLLIALFWEQASPEKKPIKKINTVTIPVQIKKQQAPAQAPQEQEQERSAVPSVSNKKKKIELKQYIISQSALDKARRIKTKKVKQEKARIKRLKTAEKRIEKERYKEQQRLKKLKAKVKQERKAKAIAEAKRKKAQKKAKLATKKAKLEEKRRQKIIKKRLAEIKKFELEKRNRNLAKKAQLAEDQRRQKARRSILEELKAQYITQIAARVKENWRYTGAQDDWGCLVFLLQDKNGYVKNVTLKSCSVSNKGREKSFKNAIIRAVEKASPLPEAPDKLVFDREIIFHFKVN
ncbi:TolA protein [Bathymodiolus thermophilus thioautotrophic gill symbiont]|uniref:Cell division and transport-associated protein TolA n=1 Tax=Bathymodiolus thermophilus thioautotrophic gill symbiont TaxID=2360 RepID=A0A1J5TU34_9GAMM|nr:cell envelope integrity protein TolA [Bathymodiolus thermophilus thioautotrophic gill symbiont]AYQ56358.1 Cell division and transport-associated protein TolA [Bathymodiolus thermophilus thioautotrophic gill symbiont]OIR24322.1 hypothetical protein BGC33_14560 [Bathymodiolus thermophilus thioautotrophic gill symbiont]CAB5506210.1 TolA protein [Bathymodiolus thermophilus thioautotrophic gill symbiont]SGZ66932.1 TolA protein [Bathymodiolus thermophilus thioautotrophic gill symbiont]